MPNFRALSALRLIANATRSIGTRHRLRRPRPASLPHQGRGDLFHMLFSEGLLPLGEAIGLPMGDGLGDGVPIMNDGEMVG